MTPQLPLFVMAYCWSNVTASQGVHEEFGGVVPELASRAHQLNIVPVVDAALKRAGVENKDLSAIAFTRGPGLLGSLLVGVSFAKGLALSLNIPLVEVNHLQAHILAHFITPSEGRTTTQPQFPFLCLLVSGGNSQIVLVKSHREMEIIGQTIDDAAGEAFDKCAKIMGLPTLADHGSTDWQKKAMQRHFSLQSQTFLDITILFRDSRPLFVLLARPFERES